MRYGKAIWAAALAAVFAAGCGQPGRIDGPAAKLPPGESSPAYLDRVASGKTVSENDAARGILLLLDGQDPAGTFQQRVEALRARGIVDASWDFQADRDLTRGKLAYMIWRACKLPGGVTLTLAGPSQRYCLRELQYRGFMAEGTMFTPVSGMEFLAVLTRADHYLQTGQVPEVLGGTGGAP